MRSPRNQSSVLHAISLQIKIRICNFNSGSCNPSTERLIKVGKLKHPKLSEKRRRQNCISRKPLLVLTFKL